MDASTMSNVPVPGVGRSPRFTGRLVVGLAIIAVGLLFLLDAFGFPGIADVWHYAGDWWPVLFVLVGVAKLANAGAAPDRLSGTIWLVAGVLLLAHNLGWFGVNVWNVFWPLLIILFGIRIVSRAIGGPGVRSGGTIVGSRTHAFALLSGVTRRQSTNDFRGGEATAVMGGCEIDLRQCDITQGPAVFDAFALMGGIDLHVPGDWTLRNEVLAVLGGIEDSRKETAGNPDKVLILRGQAIMGGIEIKN